MSLSDDDFLQSASGTVTADPSVVVSLSATAADSTVVAFFRRGTITAFSGVPTGWVSAVSTTGQACYYKRVAAGETSWTFTQPAATDCAWVAVEVANLDLVEPYESTGTTAGTASNAALGNAALATSTSLYSKGLSTVTFAVFGSYVSSGTATRSWGSYNGSWVEVLQQAPVGGTNRPNLAVARVFTDGTAASFQATATQTISSGTSSAQAFVAVFREAGSPMSVPVSEATGFEFGTHAGLAEATVNGPIVTANQILGQGVPVGTWGTHYQIGAFGRNGDYGMRISTSAATCNVPMQGPGSSGVYGFNVRPVSGSGTPTLVTFDVNTGTDLLLVWDATTEQLGLRWGAGTVEWQTGTTPANSWAWVEVRFKVNATTHTADWWCETGTGDGHQTAPADLTGMSSTSMTAKIGALGSQTVTVDFDDWCPSAFFAAFPLGPHRVVRLVPETTGATVSGTAANVKRFTANGTLAAPDGTEGALLDECPPTVSASADGICQVTTDTATYIEIPMQNLTLASDEVIAGVRMVAAMWSGSGAGAGNLQIRGYDGTTEYTLAPQANTSALFTPGSPTAYSATAPVWFAFTWPFTTPWTKTRLDAAVLRVGFSSDATPDMGVSALYLEVAIKTITAQRTLTIGDDDFTADVYVHPYNSAVTSYVITNNHPTDPINFTYSIAGTPQTPVTVTAGNSQTIDIHADNFGDISDCQLTGA